MWVAPIIPWIVVNLAWTLLSLTCCDPAFRSGCRMEATKASVECCHRLNQWRIAIEDASNKVLITTLWLHFIGCRCSYNATIKTSVFRWCSFCYQFIDAQQCIVVEGSSTEAVMSAWRGVVGTFSCKWVPAYIVLTNVSIFVAIKSINHLTTKLLPTSLLVTTH